MARYKSPLERLLSTVVPTVALTLTSFGLSGCTGCIGIYNPDDDDDTSPEATYTIDDFDVSCRGIANGSDLVEVECAEGGEKDLCYNAKEGVEALCKLNVPEDFEGSVDIQTLDLRESSILNIDMEDLSVDVKLGMYDANFTTTLEDDEIKLNNGRPRIVYKTNDPIIGEEEIVVTFDPVELDNRKLEVTKPYVDMGNFAVGEIIPGFNLAEIAGVIDREDALENVPGTEYENTLTCVGDPDQVPGMTVNNCEVPDFAIPELGDFSYVYNVVDLQGEESIAITLDFSTYGLTYVEALVSDFFTSDVLTDENGSAIESVITVSCDHQGTPDFTGQFTTDLTGYVNMLIGSAALADGAESIDCKFYFDDENDPLDVARYGAQKMEVEVTEGTTNPLLESYLIRIEPYDLNAQDATGASNTIEHLFDRNVEMGLVYLGIPIVDTLFSMGTGIVTTEFISGDQSSYFIGLYFYADDIDPTLNPPGFTGFLFEDGSNSQITFNSTDLGQNIIFNATRAVNGTNIDSAEVVIDDLYQWSTSIYGAGMLVSSGAISGSVLEGGFSIDFALDMYSNGTPRVFDLAHKQHIIRHFLLYEMDMICVTYDGYDICQGYTDGPID